MWRLDPGESYLSGVLPAVIVFGLGLTLVVAPVTATVMAAADERHWAVGLGDQHRCFASFRGLVMVAGVSSPWSLG